MRDLRVIVGEGGEVWCQNLKRWFNVRLTLNIRENEREEHRGEGGGWKGIKWFRFRVLKDVSFISFFKSFRFNWIGLVWSGSINWSFLKPKPKPNRIKWFFFIFNRFIQFFLSVHFFKLIFSQFFWFNRLIGFF
jgi:hypothetical protein